MSKSLSRRIQALSLLAAVALAPTALAEQAPMGRPYVFATVDDYTVRLDGYIEVTGVIQGEAAPRTVTFWVSPNIGAGVNFQAMSSRCDRMAMLTMAKPGAYLFTMSVEEQQNYYRQFVCKLTRLP
ncbi:hypothetical protein [Corallococcus macrosporus]|uniref:Serine/threonine protein kinase n=1 Tax=Corallococcus macrosporus DSM 14697 TaxID=1189310 RepID=A0A250K2Z8_9BACT|nr:hypothetical protein [Corallococcus macrosporus]ATB50435.1 hypothetical protein MYMAC_006091 [Corallococcus macrosporus DSM 14697]